MGELREHVAGVIDREDCGDFRNDRDKELRKLEFVELFELFIIFSL